MPHRTRSTALPTRRGIAAAPSGTRPADGAPPHCRSLVVSPAVPNTIRLLPKIAARITSHATRATDDRLDVQR